MSRVKKVINSFFSLHPVIFLSLATIVFSILAARTQGDDMIFIYLVILFGFFLIIGISSLINSFLSRFKKPKAWLIGLGLTIIVYNLLNLVEELFPNDSLAKSIFFGIWFVVFSSFVIYLFFIPFKKKYKPAGKKKVVRLASKAPLDKEKCHGEIAKSKAAIKASFLFLNNSLVRR